MGKKLNNVNVTVCVYKWCESSNLKVKVKTKI